MLDVSFYDLLAFFFSQRVTYSFNFTYFDLETCCDYVTIYDGNTMRSPKLAQ